MERYNRIANKNQREIVLLQGFPCFWGKCRFCDYTLDNSRNEEEMTALNAEILSHVTGEFDVLEVINSGSCFEIPKETLELIRDIAMLKKYFKLGTVNIFTNNSTDVKRDEQLVAWFMDKYAALLDDPAVEVLYEKTDFGVGD